MYRSMNIKSLKLAISVLILSTSVNAALVDNGSFTTDTSTNLDWLDLTETTGYSYNQMLTNFSDINSQFYGFTYATREDLTTLWVNAGYTGNFNNFTSDLNDRAVITELFNLFGQTGSNCCDRSDGMFDDGDSDANISFLYLIPELSPWESRVSISFNSLSPDDINWSSAGANDMGSWVYRDANFLSQVPIPATAWLFGSGLICLIGLARRKKV